MAILHKLSWAMPRSSQCKYAALFTNTLCYNTVPTSPSCPDGFSLFTNTGHCYMAVSIMKAWTDARDHCASLSPLAYLAGIQTVEEFDFIKSIAGMLRQ